MKIPSLFRNKLPQSKIISTDINQKISALSSNNIALVSGVNHFLGINLAKSLINRNIAVVGVSGIFNGSKTESKELLLSSKFYLVDSNQVNNLYNFINSKQGKVIKYIFLTDFYAASYSPSSLKQNQLTKLFRHQLNLIPEQLEVNRKITFIAPYINSQLKNSPFPFDKLYLSSIFHQLNTLNKNESPNFRTVNIIDCYGPDYDLDGGVALSQILSGIKQGKSQINISFSIQQRIFPLHVNDAIEGILKATFALNTYQKQFILANSIGITLNDFVYQLKNIFYLSNNFQFKNQQPEIENLIDHQEITKNYQLLNWKPKINLKLGLPSITEWLKPPVLNNTLNNYSWVSSVNQSSSTLQRIIHHSQDNQTLAILPKRNIFFQAINKIKIKSRKFINNILDFIIPHQFKIVILELSYKLPALPNLSYLWKPLLISVLVLSLITPPIFLGLLVVQSSLALKQSFQRLRNGQFNQAANQAEYAEEQFNNLNQLFSYTLFLNQVPLINTIIINVQDQLELASLGSQVINSSAVSMVLLQETIKTTLDPSIKTDPRIPMSQAYLYLNKNQRLLAELQALLPNQLPYYSRKVISQAKYQQVKQQLPPIRSQLQTLIDGLSNYPNLAGYAQPQNYLIIFQNNRELRPTGGFIGSLALVTFDQGKLSQWDIYDVYDADGQLMGYVEPPDPISNYLGEASWYLRDANWDPDFPTTAKKLKWFINKELKSQVSGVIAIDVDFIQQLVAGLGGVYLPDQQVTITAENFYQYMQEKSELNFFPGSRQKGDYLSIIADAILYKFKHQPNLDWIGLTNNLQRSIASKHALFYLDHSPSQSLITQLNYGGNFTLNYSSAQDISSLLSQAKHYSQNGQVLSVRSDLINDHLAIVEANMGVNKVNQYIVRQISQQVNISQDQLISQQLQIYYQNQSTPDSWLGGDYKNYLRLYLPIGTQINNILVGPADNFHLDKSDANNQSETSKLMAIDLDFVDQTREHGFDVFGFLINIPQQSSYLLQVDYTLPKIKLPNQFTYHLNLIKQPGTNDDPYWLTINYPENYQPTNSQLQSKTDQSEVETSDNSQTSTDSNLTPDHTLRYNMQLSKDQFINVSFIKDKIRSL